MNLQSRPAETAKRDISVRPLRESDLSTADHIMRVALGTFLVSESANMATAKVNGVPPFCELSMTFQ